MNKLSTICLFLLCGLTFGINADARINNFSDLPNIFAAQNIIYTANGSEQWKIRVRSPNQTKNSESELTLEKPGLIIGLHWRKTSKRSYKTFSRCLAEKAFKDYNAYIISPDSGDELWYTEDNQKKILHIVKDAKNAWNIDSRKIIIVGYSNGGIGSWFYADKYPTIFSAAIAIAATYPKTKTHSIATPLYVIHSPKDEIFPLQQIKDVVKSYTDIGSDITFVQTKRLSHYQACRYKNYLEDALPWLESVLTTAP